MASIDEEIKNQFPNNKIRLIANVMFTANWMNGLFTEQLRPFDLSMQQFNILRILRGAGDWIAMTEVKNRMVEKSPNATRMVDKLINKQLVERQRSDSDRRVVYIRLTKKGALLLEEIDQQDNEAIRFIEHITDEEAGQVSEILDKLRQ